MDWYEKVDFGVTVYYKDETGEVQATTLGELARENCDIVTSPYGVCPRYHLRGTELWSWGVRGNHPFVVERFDSKEEAEHALMLSHKYDLDTEGPQYFYSRDEALDEEV